MTDPPRDQSAEPEPQHARTADTPPTIPSEQLLRGAREVRIQHAGDVYRLRLTRSGKLILHK